MSDLGLGDYMMKKSLVDIDDDPFDFFNKDLDDIDLPVNMNLENSSFMSSEFFDSVFSMEVPTNPTNDLGLSPLSNVDSDFGTNGSDVDEIRLVNSCSPDSGNSSTGFELNDCVIVKEEKIATQDSSKEPTEAIKTIPAINRSKLYVGSPVPKKVIVTKPFSTKPRKNNVQNSKQIFRVQSISGNGRSVLLPFNVAKLKNIKIINGNELQVENIKVTKVSPNKSYVDNYVIPSPETQDDDSDSLDAKSDRDGQNLEVNLTDEEKRLLAKEGIYMPSHYPLSKQQERELKRIRRKIRNKISAQDSRKRKKEYVDGLEERIRQGAEEKKMLLNRVKQLEQQRNRLIVQMNKLQALVANTSISKATPSASLFIVLLSVLLITLPNLKAPQDTEWKDQQQATARRALLSKASMEDSQRNLDEFLTFNKDDESELQNMLYDDENNTDESVPYSKYFKNFGTTFDDVDQRFKNKDGLLNLLENAEFEDDLRDVFGKVQQFLQQTNFEDNSYMKKISEDDVQIKRKFIEPDIDDDTEFVPKRYKFSSNEDPNVVSATVLVKSPSKKE